jgi:DNA repair photolyase
MKNESGVILAGMNRDLPPPPAGRGTGANPPGRFERLAVEPDPDAAAGQTPVPTEYFRDGARTLITSNDSPDIPYTFSVNPYRGCEHGCIYCYARPYHEYLGLSAGLDFETRIFVKEDAPRILRRELARKSWKGEALALCGVTDPYQPIERRLRLTRGCLEVCAEYRQPVSIVTKSGLVVRDIDVLADLARFQAVEVALTLTTLDEPLRRALEPRASSAQVRLSAIEHLAGHHVPVGVMVAPVIPGLTDHEIPRILARAAEKGASYAACTMLRLPHGVAALFDDWLRRWRPDARAKVLERVRQVHGGCLTDNSCGRRMLGEGAFADLTAQLFDAARERAGLAPAPPALSSAAFRARTTPQRMFTFEDGD